MKNLFSLLPLIVLSVLFSSCADDDNGNFSAPPSEAMSFSYTGSLLVGDATMNDVVVDVDINHDGEGFMSITMRDVKFSENMPVTLDVTLPRIPCVETDGLLMFSGENIVPLVGGRASEDYRFKIVSGRVNADASGITFVAQMAQDLAAYVAGKLFVYDAEGSAPDDGGGVVVPPATETFDYNFEGSLQVGSFSLESAALSVAVSRETGTLDLKMHGVKFTENMPTLDITLCGLACENAGGVVRFSGENIVPLVGTNPRADYTFATASGTFDMRSSTLTFYAQMSPDLAAYVAGKEFNYNGILKQ